jgi:hypothetical protein
MATNTTNHTTGTRAGEKEKIYLTREGYEEKKARLHFLVTERRQEIADYIHDAKEAGDVRRCSKARFRSCSASSTTPSSSTPPK